MYVCFLYIVCVQALIPYRIQSQYEREHVRRPWMHACAHNRVTTPLLGYARVRCMPHRLFPCYPLVFHTIRSHTHPRQTRGASVDSVPSLSRVTVRLFHQEQVCSHARIRSRWALSRRSYKLSFLHASTHSQDAADPAAFTLKQGWYARSQTPLLAYMHKHTYT